MTPLNVSASCTSGVSQLPTVGTGDNMLAAQRLQGVRSDALDTNDTTNLYTCCVVS